MGNGIASISVDLDSLHHYARIHGLDQVPLPDATRALVYTRAVPRFLSLMADLKLPSTLFAIGEDAAEPWGREVLQRAVAEGVEIGNHTRSHPYALTRLPDAELDAEVSGGADAIEAAVGVRPVGFRAPGYTLNARLYALLASQGYAYDSSVFPALPYYLAKAAVMAAIRMGGRRSRAVLDSPRVLLAPRLPYRPAVEQVYRRGAGTVLELPITVAPWTRVPFIGTLVVVFPPWVVRALYATLHRAPIFNFELHGVDFLDESDGIPAALAHAQRDLRIPVAVKLARLRTVFEALARDFEVMTLRDAASRLAPALPGLKSGGA